MAVVFNLGRVRATHLDLISMLVICFVLVVMGMIISQEVNG